MPKPLNIDEPDCICVWPDGCGGSGALECGGCGGDLCVCRACYGHGEMDCHGCGDCEGEPDGLDDWD